VFQWGFFHGENGTRNVFDLAMVCLQLFDDIGTALKIFTGDLKDVLRLLRLCRIIRFIRLLHFVNELRSLVISIVDSLTSLIWLLLLMFMMTYIFGVVLTQVVTDYKVNLGRTVVMEDRAVLEDYFGSLDRSMIILYQAISEGIHWSEVAQPLSEFLSPWFDVIVGLYMAFVLFAVMNVVTAVVVEKALRDAEEEKEKYMSQDTWDMFLAASKSPCQDGEIGITKSEFDRSFSKPQMKEYLRLLNLGERTAKQYNLFELIDEDGNGVIDLQELVDSCMRLAGAAKAVDVAMLSREVKAERKLAQQHRQRLEKLQIEELLQLLPSQEAPLSVQLSFDTLSFQVQEERTKAKRCKQVSKTKRRR